MKRFKTYEQFINEDFDKSDRVISAKDLLETEYEDMLDFEGKWEILYGEPSPDFSMMITGAPGSGKTTFLLEFAYYLASNFGSVIYISSEEFGSVTLAEKLEDIIKEKGLSTGEDNTFKIPENLFFAKGMTDLQDYKFIIIDSVNDLSLDLMDYKEVRDIYTDKAFISVLQYTKAGDYRGGKDWEHEMDIACDIDNGVVSTFKNRYGVKGKYDYFNDEDLTDQNFDEE